MIKKRFGEEFHTAIAERLEVRQTETRKAAGDRKRKVIKGKRQQREEKPDGRKVESQETQQIKTEQKSVAL
jgi:hypothetical protein